MPYQPFGSDLRHKSPPTYPPTNARNLLMGNALSKRGKRRNPGFSWVSMSIRNAKGYLYGLRSRRLWVRPPPGTLKKKPVFATFGRKQASCVFGVYSLNVLTSFGVIFFRCTFLHHCRHLLYSFIFSVLHQMGVSVCRCGEVPMSEPLLNHFQVNTGRQHQAGLCMPQIVEHECVRDANGITDRIPDIPVKVRSTQESTTGIRKYDRHLFWIKTFVLCFL